MLRGGIVKLYGNSVFNSLRNCQTIFQSGCNILHSHQRLRGLQLFHILTNTCYSKLGHCWWQKGPPLIITPGQSVVIGTSEVYLLTKKKSEKIQFLISGNFSGHAMSQSPKTPILESIKESSKGKLLRRKAKHILFPPGDCVLFNKKTRTVLYLYCLGPQEYLGLS